ncbi:transmembrane signal receptor [Lithospermum erythrorhizon]|uniref:Transmembrane signal receptor n=1 Tax=Lithospermum erythrorhizon TaxID=34254 RepID=A0AAV3RYD2_LITER
MMKPFPTLEAKRGYEFYSVDASALLSNRHVVQGRGRGAYHHNGACRCNHQQQIIIAFPTDCVLPVLHTHVPSHIFFLAHTNVTSPDASRFSSEICPSLITSLETSNDILPTRSHRVTSAPTHLKDYLCYNVHKSFGLQSNFDNLHFPTTFVASISSLIEPTTYKVASKELEALTANGTWVYMPLPPGKRLVSCRWVYIINQKADGSIERFKARLVAKGFTQKHGIDYHETFSPMVKMSTVRCVLVVAAFNHWNLYQLDVNNAFLHGESAKEVYLRPPDGVEVPQGTVCRIRYTDTHSITQLKLQLHKKFSIKDLGFLQCKFVSDMIKENGILQQEKAHKLCLTPLPLNTKLHPHEGAELQLNFLTNTRPDIAFSVQTLSQFMQCPRESHLSTLHHQYRAMAQASAEVTWLVRLLADLGIDDLQPVTLFCDNTSAIHIIKNPVFHERIKHINIYCHFTKEKILHGLISLSHVPTSE